MLAVGRVPFRDDRLARFWFLPLEAGASITRDLFARSPRLLADLQVVRHIRLEAEVGQGGREVNLVFAFR